MTMKIEVTIPEEEVKAGAAAQYLGRAMLAIGFSRAYEAAMNDAVTYGSGAVLVTGESAQAVNLRMSDEDIAAQKAEAIAATEAMQAEAPKRERGKPAPGRARRTKEEIAEDEAADRAEAVRAEVAAEASAMIAQDDPSRKEQIDKAVANISTGEERIDPTTAEDAAQDAADEAAEVAATPAKVLSHDDVRDALNKYVKAYGMPAAMEDGPKVFGMIFGASVVKVSDIPLDHAALSKAIAGVEEMLAKNPFKREALL